MSDKPTYRVPSMEQVIHMRGTNGYTMVSTFSGCGGSCLGFEMAGFKPLRAHEFIAAAAEAYQANHPNVEVDTRDLRFVRGDEILQAIGLQKGELDVLEGSPPCSAFSTAGNRAKDWGKIKDYSDGAQRTDDLFYEYSRLIGDIQPKVFVAENVPGLIMGKAKGYFLLILQSLKDNGYRVEARVLDSQWMGVPQSRKRLIFVGVRNDLLDKEGNPLQPAFPTPLSYNYTIREAFIGCPPPNGKDEEGLPIRNKYLFEYRKLLPGQRSTKYFQLERCHPDKPSHTILAAAHTAAGVTHPFEARKFHIPELRRLQSFPDDFKLTGGFRTQWERIGRSVPPLMMEKVAATVRDDILGRMK